MEESPNLRLLTLYATPQQGQSKIGKLLAIIAVYARLIYYAVGSSAPIFHILWNYKFTLFDRTLLLIFYRLLGKQLVFTAHNVNAGARDGADTFLNRSSLRIQYRLMDQIFVHTQKMKDELIQAFGILEEQIAIIPFGTYDMVPQSSIDFCGGKATFGAAQVRSDDSFLRTDHAVQGDRSAGGRICANCTAGSEIPPGDRR